MAVVLFQQGHGSHLLPQVSRPLPLSAASSAANPSHLPIRPTGSHGHRWPLPRSETQDPKGSYLGNRQSANSDNRFLSTQHPVLQ